jgi:hypothetical protein
MLMNIQSEKLELLKLILNTENPSIIRKLKAIFNKEKDFWETLSNSEQEEILKGIDELDKGESIPYEQFIKNTFEIQSEIKNGNSR